MCCAFILKSIVAESESARYQTWGRDIVRYSASIVGSLASIRMRLSCEAMYGNLWSQKSRSGLCFICCESFGWSRAIAAIATSC